MNINPIKTEQDYEATLDRIGELMGCSVDTPEADELDMLVTLTEAYEAKHYPIDKPDPIEVIKFYLEQYGLQQKDLEKFIGHSGRVSEVLSYKRRLTLQMIQKLHEGLKIPAEQLVKDYDIEPKRSQKGIAQPA
ncbi:helix-turn-helix domain-containing protein [Zooshikella sp. RANM57]|uniref:helix-turn-helix domain-containing protein n=1 Tax=Zooshikella sp. RANM57 TaxID=3425863 RepID=UPI003D6ECA0B